MGQKESNMKRQTLHQRQNLRILPHPIKFRQSHKKKLQKNRNSKSLRQTNHSPIRREIPILLQHLHLHKKPNARNQRRKIDRNIPNTGLRRPIQKHENMDQRNGKLRKIRKENTQKYVLLLHNMP